MRSATGPAALPPHPNRSPRLLQPAAPGTAAAASPGLAAAGHAPAVATATGNEWRVVAFTYNRQDQAQKKASTLSHSHPDLHPEVFSPRGKAPFLVTVGGPSIATTRTLWLARLAASGCLAIPTRKTTPLAKQNGSGSGSLPGSGPFSFVLKSAISADRAPSRSSP